MHTLAHTLAEVQVKKRGDKTLADSLAEVKAKTVSDALGRVEAESLVNMFPVIVACEPTR